MQNVETLIGKQVSFGVLYGTKMVEGSGKITSISISPLPSTKASLGLVGDRAAENIIIPSNPGQGTVLGVKVIGGKKNTKTLKKRKSKY
jgi:hypothetical protein